MMGRPKTKISTYVAMTLRLPPTLRARLDQLIGESGIPVNTKLVHLIDKAMAAEEKASRRKAKHPERVSGGKVTA
jgi:hypothetical protein